MKTLKKISEVKNIQKGNSYKYQEGKNWFCIDFEDDEIQLRIVKTDNRKNIDCKYYFRKTVKSILNVILKNF